MNSINNHEGFQRFAPYNDTFYVKPNPLRNEEYQLLEKYLKNIQINGNRHLDVGCGTGDFCFFMANNGYNVTGMDYSDNMLLVARNKINIFKKDIETRKQLLNNPNISISEKDKNLVTSVVPKIKFLKDDVTAPTLVKEQFNLVTFLNTLNYIDPVSSGPAFKNLSKLMFAGGCIVVNLVTRLEFEHCVPICDVNEYFDYEIKFSYDRESGINVSTFQFNESKLIQNPFEIKFMEFEHSVGETINNLTGNDFEIIKIIPNTPVYSAEDSDLTSITEAIEKTYSMPNGVRSVIFIARKK